MGIQITTAVQEVLAQARTDGNSLVLTGQLDRKLYTEVNKVLEALGGKWDRKAKAHLFDEDATELVENVLMTGEYTRVKQDLGQFDTPEALADLVVEKARILPGMKVLEPNAGIGRMVKAVIGATDSGAEIFGYEIDPKRHKDCVSNCFRAFGAGGLGLGDFLTVEPNPVFDRVVMNPPFAKQADIDHVLHALKFLKPGGRLVAIMSSAIKFRSNAKTAAFWLEVAPCAPTWHDLPAGSFKESGTNVNAGLLVLDKTGD